MPTPALDRQSYGGVAALSVIFVNDGRTAGATPQVLARWPYPTSEIGRYGRVRQPVALDRCQALPGQSAVMLRAYAIGMSDAQAGAFERVAAFVNHTATGGWAQLGATSAPFTASDDPAWDVTFHVVGGVIEVRAKGAAAATRWSLHVTLHTGTEP